MHFVIGFAHCLRHCLGEVKTIKEQPYLSNQEIYTSTRLVSVVLKGTPPHFITVGGCLCRIWYRGQPLMCNLCAVRAKSLSTVLIKISAVAVGNLGILLGSVRPLGATLLLPL